MRKYTWKPDLPDHRDLKFNESTMPKAMHLPSVVDLRKNYDNVYDQGTLGSCTANAISLAYDFERIGQGMNPLLPSRLFIYYNERTLEGTVLHDNGAQIRDGIKSLASLGVCSEADWPYVPAKFKTKPGKKCYTRALTHVIKQYLRIDNTNLNDLKTCLASGFGFVLGFSVYEGFESAEVAATGQAELPRPGEKMIGGHAVFCLGYDDSLGDHGKFIVRNSWGIDWGDHGHFYIPYEYFTNPGLASDFWTIRLVA